MPKVEQRSLAKGLEKKRKKTVNILEAKSFSEAEALANLGFVFVGMDDVKNAFIFKEPEREKR